MGRLCVREVGKLPIAMILEANCHVAALIVVRKIVVTVAGMHT